MKHFYSIKGLGTFVIIMLLGLSVKTFAQKKIILKNDTHLSVYKLMSNEDIIKHHAKKYEHKSIRKKCNIDKLLSIKKLSSTLEHEKIISRQLDIDEEKKDEIVYYPSIKNMNGNDIYLYDSSYYYNWDFELHDWVADWKYINSYDANGNLIEEISYYWDSYLNNWIKDRKYAISFDVNGNMIEHIEYNWNFVLNGWIGYSKHEYSYDANGNRTQEILYGWDSELNDWVVSGKSVYSYDVNVNGNRIVEISYRWVSELNDWVLYWKYVNSYDANGDRTEEIWYKWNSVLNEWVEDWKWVYSYNANGSMTENIGFKWNLVLNEWDEDWKNEFSYDMNENMLMNNVYYWNSQINNWIGVNKFENSYDANGNKTEEISYYNWDSELTNWVVDSKLVFYWSLYTKIIEISIPETFKIYPNPSSGNINFTSEELLNKSFKLELVNLNGQIIHSRSINFSNTYYNINFPDLSKGMYILKIQSNDFLKTKKIVIE